jgi:hypothetical protein
LSGAQFIAEVAADERLPDQWRMKAVLLLLDLAQRQSCLETPPQTSPPERALTVKLEFDRELWMHFCPVARFSDDSDG